MSRYVTKQRGTLLEYLNQHPDELLSTKQIAEGLCKENISVSAVYRNLADLEAEGKVRRYAQNGSREVYFQFIDSKTCKGHMHMHCICCGRTFHLDDDVAENLQKSLWQKETFRLEINDCILSGVCKECIEKEAHFE